MGREVNYVAIGNFVFNLFAVVVFNPTGLK